ncbi:hypothetical protein SAY86_029061 [Trapa natans]|uniref:Uncharacterized protein n=1 Tax=Trapa natans TaxID=22666 RepID=A0AAN7MGE5_TRANT|nr:hypothetical protein SAY86_029061 [Trapa natans]
MVHADDGRPPHRIDPGDVSLTEVGQVHSHPVEDLPVAKAPLIARHSFWRDEELPVVNAIDGPLHRRFFHSPGFQLMGLFPSLYSEPERLRRTGENGIRESPPDSLQETSCDVTTEVKSYIYPCVIVYSLWICGAS